MVPPGLALLPLLLLALHVNSDSNHTTFFPPTHPDTPKPTHLPSGNTTTTPAVTSSQAPTPPPNVITTTLAPQTTLPTNTTTAPTTTTQASTTQASTTPVANSTTVKPTGSPVVTTASSPTSKNNFSGPSFIGGIVLALGMVGIGVVGWKYYKARTERNYRTL